MFPQCCCLGVGACRDLPASQGPVPLARVAPVEAITTSTSPSRPRPPPIHSAARRTITSLAPASSVHLSRDVKNEPHLRGRRLASIAPRRRGRDCTPCLAFPYPDTPSSPAIASIAAQHAALPGWRVPGGGGAPGRGGGNVFFMEDAGGWRGACAITGLPPGPAAGCWGSSSDSSDTWGYVLLRTVVSTLGAFR